MENNQLVMKKNADLSFTIATRLKQLREEKALSHQRLCESLDKTLGITISRDSLINYEVDSEYHPASYKNLGMRIEYLHALAAFYGVSTDYILGLTDTKSPAQEVQDVCRITGLSENSICSLLRYVDFDECEDSHIAPFEGFDSSHADYVIDLVNDFICFALNRNEKGILPFEKYFIFRQANEEYSRSREVWGKMTLEEKQVEFIRLAGIGMHSLRFGFHVFSLDDASDYYRTAFCDDFKDFLSTEYSLDRLSGTNCKED